MPFSVYEQWVVMTVCHWSCRITLEAMSPMSSGMGDDESLEPVNSLCGEAAGESWLPLLSHPAEAKQIRLSSSQSSVLPSLIWPEEHVVRMDFFYNRKMFISWLKSCGAVGCFF